MIDAASYVDAEFVVKLTQDLVRIPSVYNPDEPHGNEQAAAEFVASLLREMGLTVHLEEVVPGRPNVIGIFDTGKPGKTLLFEGHTDVVTAGERGAWTYEPFGAAIDNGRIYGRGSCDTKGNLAAAIAAVQALLHYRDALSGKVILCVPCDEEGMMIGIKDFIRRGWADGVDGAVICEPEDNHVCITQKGAMRAVLHVHGKMAHGAMPLTGINPNTRMARAIVALDALEQREKERLGEHPMLGWPSITPTILRAPVEGPPQINVMPGECMTTLDIRTVPGQIHETLKTQIESELVNLAKSDPDFRYTLEFIEERPWTDTPREDAVVVAAARSVEEITGKPAVYDGVPGATDGTFLHMAGVPIVTIGAGDKYIPHHADEYVEIAQLVETTKIFAQLAVHFLCETDGR